MLGYFGSRNTRRVRTRPPVLGMRDLLGRSGAAENVRGSRQGSLNEAGQGERVHIAVPAPPQARIIEGE